MVARGWRGGETGDIGQRVQTFSYKRTKFHKSNVHHGDIVKSIVSHT